jgi:hypothetical protein
MRLLIVALLFLSNQEVYGQNTSATFVNFGKPIASFGRERMYASKIHEITLSEDSTFEFWSRPSPSSCITWHQYKGKWSKKKDTIFFRNDYEIVERGIRATYRRDSRPSFLLSFRTDNNSELFSRSIKIQFIYDFNAHLNDTEKVFDLKSDNTIEIPFEGIPNFGQLASLKIEYRLRSNEKRIGYLTEGKTANVKIANLPNNIYVEFVENLRKETVYRTIKGTINRRYLSIVSIQKTTPTLPDYYQDLEFENRYFKSRSRQ